MQIQYQLMNKTLAKHFNKWLPCSIVYLDDAEYCLKGSYLRKSKFHIYMSVLDPWGRPSTG